MPLSTSAAALRPDVNVRKLSLVSTVSKNKLECLLVEDYNA
jgi:hypothetical protein